MVEFTAIGLAVLLFAARPSEPTRRSRNAAAGQGTLRLRPIYSGPSLTEPSIVFGWPFEFVEVQMMYYYLDQAYGEDLVIFDYCQQTGESFKSVRSRFGEMTRAERSELARISGRQLPEPPSRIALEHWDNQRIRWGWLAFDGVIILAILGFVAFAPIRTNGPGQKWYQFAVLDLLRWILVLAVLFGYPWTSASAVDAARTVAFGVVACGMVLAGTFYLHVRIVPRRAET